MASSSPSSDTYLLLLRPAVQVVAVDSALRLVRGDNALIHDSGLDVLQLLPRSAASSTSTTCTSLLLLSTGGVLVYLLYKNREDGRGREQRRSSRSALPRWASRSWLSWIFGGDEDNLRRSYFGPNVVTDAVGQRKPAKIHYLLPTATSTPSNVIIDDGASLSADEDFLNTTRPYLKRRPSALGRDSEQRLLGCGDSKCKDPFCSGVSASVLPRDETTDSIRSVSGSMVDLVKGAREVRRLIREASCESIDLNKWCNEAASGIETELADLKENCEAIDEKFRSFEMYNKNSASTVPGSSVKSGSSNASDLCLLRRLPPQSHFWRIADEDDSSALHWDVSPLHHDSKKTKYKVAVSSSRSTSEVDPWEWDAEDVPEWHNPPGAHPSPMLNHQKWLPENADHLELDLEAELRPSSRSSSVNYANKIRQPPSGRSSVDRSLASSGDNTPREPIDHEALVRSFLVKSRSDSISDSSGFNSMESSMTTSGHYPGGVGCISSVLTLSPVHEAAKESDTPVMKKREEKVTKIVGEDETLQVVIE